MSDSQGRNKNGPGLSRRDFFRGAGATAAAGLVPLATTPAAAEEVAPVGAVRGE